MRQPRLPPPHRAGASSTFPPTGSRSALPRMPATSTPPRRCATASSTNRWVRGRCPGWRRRGGGRRHLSPDPPRGGPALRPVLYRRRIRHRAAGRLSRRNPRTRPLLRRSGLSRTRRDAALVGRHRRLCLPLRHRADVRLRQPARHRSRRPGGAAQLSVSPSPGAAGAAGARPARALCRHAPPRPGDDRPGAHARRAAAADQGLSAARRVRRRRRGRRSPVQHHRRVRRGQDRPGDPEIHPSLRTAGERVVGVAGMGSTTLRIWRLALYLIVTVALMPVQALGVGFGCAWATTFPRVYHRICCRILGFRLRRIGRPTARRPALFACNHVSYLDITVLGALIPGSFIAKAEVARWPLFGWLAKLQRSVFVDRQVRSTAEQRNAIAARLAAGDALILFPEGTSGDGSFVLPFKSALFSVAEPAEGAPEVAVQPVSITYTRLDGIPIGRAHRPLFAWYGDMAMAPHLWRALGLGVV